MENNNQEKKLNKLGIFFSEQLETNSLSFWWQKKYKEIQNNLELENPKESLIEINNLLDELEKFDLDLLKKVLKNKKVFTFENGQEVNPGEIVNTEIKDKLRDGSQMHIYKGSPSIHNLTVSGILLKLIGLGILEKKQHKIFFLRFPRELIKETYEDSAIEALQKSFPHLVDMVRFSQPKINSLLKESISAWNIAKGVIESSFYSSIILEGFGDILSLKILDQQEIINTITQTSSEVNLFFIGKKFPSDIFKSGYFYLEIEDRSKKNNSNSNKKLSDGIEIYTGEKGQTATAFGKALQVIAKGISQGKGHRVLILQWLKGWAGSEDAAIDALRKSYPHLVDHLRSGRDAIVWRGQQQPIDYVEAERMWEIAKAAIFSGLYKKIILDELNTALELELLPVESIHQTLLKKPSETEVILTGRCKNEPSYFQLANVYSEMVCHKHYANVGVDLKRGVDY